MLNNLVSPKSTRKSKIIGRGMGSGKGGHTAGRGLKGATARSGYQYPRRTFEGGQNPLSRRLPRYRGDVRGTTRNAFTADIQNAPIKLSKIVEVAEQLSKTEITIQDLIETGIVILKYNKTIKPKILLDKEISVKLTIKGIPASKSAKAAIEKAGGSIEE